MLEGKAYSELEPGTETEEELEACQLLINSQGKELLAPGKGADQAENKKIVLRLVDGQVCYGCVPLEWLCLSTCHFASECVRLPACLPACVCSSLGSSCLH